MSFPINIQQFEEFDLGKDFKEMERLMMGMTKDELTAMLGAMEIPVDKKEKKERIVKSWLSAFKASQEHFERRNHLAESSGRQVVSVSSVEEAQRLADEARRNNPNASVRIVHSEAEYDELLAEIANENPSSGGDASREPVPSETRETFETFKGQGYKLGEVAEKKVIIPEAIEKEVVVQDLNATPDEMKGTLKIYLETSLKKHTFNYHYHDGDAVADVKKALLENFGIDCTKDGMFSLKWCGDGKSTLHDWEPIFATLHEVKECEIVASMSGGGRFKVKKLTKKEQLDTAQKEAQQVATHQARGLECIQAMDNEMNKFNTMVAENPKNAIGYRISSLSEKGLVDAKVALQTNGGSEYKLKFFARALFGEPLDEVKKLCEITTNIIRASEIAVILAVEQSENANDPISLQWLRGLVNDYHNRRVGAREALGDVPM